MLGKLYVSQCERLAPGTNIAILGLGLPLFPYQLLLLQPRYFLFLKALLFFCLNALFTLHLVSHLQFLLFLLLREVALHLLHLKTPLRLNLSMLILLSLVELLLLHLHAFLFLPQQLVLQLFLLLLLSPLLRLQTLLFLQLSCRLQSLVLLLLSLLSSHALLLPALQRFSLPSLLLFQQLVHPKVLQGLGS